MVHLLNIQVDLGGCFSRRNLYTFIEPVGSVSPKVNVADELKITRGKVGSDVSLLCLAQSFPTPAFR